MTTTDRWLVRIGYGAAAIAIVCQVALIPLMIWGAK